MTKIDFIKKELADLDVQPGSDAYIFIYDQACEAADLLTKVELSRLIEDHLESFTLQQRGF